MKQERVPIREFFETEEDACTSCSEKTVNCCGLFHIKRWCLLILLLSLLTIGFMIPFIIYAAFFGEATSCRLTYSTNNNVTEADMQRWMKKDNWPLSVPTYDPWRRTCVCKGYEDKDPMTLAPTDEVLVWIAPGDLVSLSDEGKIPALHSNFVSKHRNHYAKEEHVKVCLPQELVVDLWNIANDTADGGSHCHATTGSTSSNVERFFLGWDGALFCSSRGRYVAGYVAAVVAVLNSALGCKKIEDNRRTANNLDDNYYFRAHYWPPGTVFGDNIFYETRKIIMTKATTDFGCKAQAQDGELEVSRCYDDLVKNCNNG